MSRKNPTVTVIILHYNEFTLTKKCVQSVSKSRYDRFDILVIDNGSTDDSSKKLKEFCRNKNISFHRTPKNRFYAGGCNMGARHAKGELVIFLNNDTEVDPDWISALVNYSEGNQKIFIQPQVLFSDKRKTVDNRGGKYTWFGHGIGIGRNQPMMRVTSRTIDYTVGTACMINRLFFLELGGFDEWYRGYYEDVDLSLRLRSRGGECKVCYNSLVYHQGSLTYKKHIPTSSHILDIRKNRLRTIIKNFHGLELYARMTVALISYLALLIYDSNHFVVTVQAVYYAFQPNKFRL